MDAHPEVGIGGAMLVGRDGSWQPSARMFPSLLNDLLISCLDFRRDSRAPASSDASIAPGPRSPTRPKPIGCLEPTRSSAGAALETVGSFDGQFFLYYEEVDLCRRFKNAGYKIFYWPDIVVIHLGGESSENALSQFKMSTTGRQLTLWRMRSALLYYRKHHGWQAWLARQEESLWHWLQARRNRGSQKANDSLETVQLLEKAWHDTHGGRVSPAQPW